MEKNKISYLLLLFILLSIFLSFYINEDSTGGAQNDYNHHEKYIFLFAENFKDTFNKYGNEFMARNSPVFYILQSVLIKAGATIEIVNYSNIIILPLLFIIFIKCIDVKYAFIKFSYRILFCSIIFISPTVRSLVVWPYPFIWGLLFFLLSIYFYLKFNVANNNKKFNYSIYNVFFLALSSYITPNFSIFSIFYLYNFYNYFKNFEKKKILLIIFFNLLLASPAIFYYIKTDFYIFKYTVESVDYLTKYNFFNKIIIITSLIFFYFIPFINIKDLKKLKVKILLQKKSTILALVLCFLSFALFNFPSNLGFGGGIFLHLSNKLFDNYYLLFLIFILAITIFYHYGMFNKNNLILFFCLIAYNAQTSIYHKYFDPLLYFIIILLFQFNSKIKLSLNITLFYKIFIFYGSFLVISLFKKLIIY